MKKIVLGLLFMMSFSFATNEGTKELVNFLGFTGVSVSLDLAALVSVLIALITWKLTKDKERNELKEKYKDSARKEVVEYLGKLRDTAKNLINFKNEYDKVSQNLTNEQKKELQLNNAYLITEYQKDLMEFLLTSSSYSKVLYKILKESKDDFELAKKHGSIEIIVFSSVITMGKLLAEYIDEDTANDLLKTFYNITKENAEKKLQEFKNHFERK
jgi:hypothetical protein